MIDPPNLQLQTDLDPFWQQRAEFERQRRLTRGGDVVVRNGAGQVVLQGKLDDNGHIEGRPTTAQLDGTLTVEITRTDGVKITDIFTHRPGEYVRLQQDVDTGKVTGVSHPPPGQQRLSLFGGATGSFANRDGATFFRQESGGAVTKTPLFKFDADGAAQKYELGLNSRFALPLGNKWYVGGLQIKGEYGTGSGRDGLDSYNPGGQTIGLYSPGASGGYATGNSLSGIRFEGDYSFASLEARMSKFYEVYGGKMESFVGLRGGGRWSEESVAFDIPALSRSFRQDQDITSFNVGPFLGSRLTWRVLPGASLWTEGRLGADYNRGSASWETALTGFNNEAQTLNRDELTWNGRFAIGADFRVSDRSRLGLNLGLDYTGNEPRLEFPDTSRGDGGARIKYGDRLDLGIGVRFLSNF